MLAGCQQKEIIWPCLPAFADGLDAIAAACATGSGISMSLVAQLGVGFWFCVAGRTLRQAGASE